MAFHHTACFVFTVMIICNAILYPSIFSNIFRQWFGLGAKEEKPETPPAYPPHMRHNGPRSPPNRGPMAGERAAAQMAQSQKEGGGKSRGMMSSVLPVYAIGIVVYFAYIMYRIFFKEQSQQDPITGQPMNRNASEDDYGATLEARKHREYEERLQRSLQQDLRSDKYRYSASADTRRTKKTAMAANRKGDEESDVASLQKRLEDTEKAMQKMMEYMNKMGVAMSQVTEQMAQNDPSGPVVNKRDSPTHAPFATDQDIDNLDDGYMDEDDYEEEVIVKKVPVRRTPQGKKYAPVRKTVGQRAKSHVVKTVKSRPPPKRRVVYVEEVDDDEEEEEGHVQDLEPSNDDYQGYLREDDDDRHPDRMAGDGEDDDQDGLEDGDDDGQKFDDAEEDEDEDGNDEAEDYDDDDDEVEVIEGETILPESVNDMPESIRRRAVKIENHGGNTEN